MKQAKIIFKYIVFKPIYLKYFYKYVYLYIDQYITLLKYFKFCLSY